jgi:hypothetical protein
MPTPLIQKLFSSSKKNASQHQESKMSREHRISTAVHFTRGWIEPTIGQPQTAASDNRQKGMEKMSQVGGPRHLAEETNEG